MARVRKCLWMVAAVAALPAPAAAQGVCTALERFAAAARETPPFGSVCRALAAGEVIVPGFQARDCSADARGISCDDISFNVSNFDTWPEPLNCPGVVRAPMLGRVLRRPERQHAYFLIQSGLRIDYGFSCWGCAGGPHSYVRVGFQGQGRAGE